MIGLVFFSLSLIFLLVCLISSAQLLINVTTVILTIVGGIVARYPKAIWETNELRLIVNAKAVDITPQPSSGRFHVNILLDFINFHNCTYGVCTYLIVWKTAKSMDFVISLVGLTVFMTSPINQFS